MSAVSAALRRVLALTVICLVGAPTVHAQPATHDIVDRIDQENYRHYLDDLLYTHPGDDRGFGPEHDLARANIQATLQSFGLDVYLHPFDYEGTTYYNVVAVKEGLVYPAKQFIVGAHFDSVNNPGADDNGSGTAGVLEIARVLSQYDFERTMIFIAFDREEQGLWGSEAYAMDHQDDGILGMISMDMIAYNTGADSVDIYGRTDSTPLKDALADAVLEYGEGLSVDMRGQMDASNHAPFEWFGFDACLIIEDWGNPYYHTEFDHVEMPGYIDYDFATKVVRSVTGWLVEQAVVMDEPCPGDIDGDGQVSFPDLITMLAAWGSCDGEPCPADLDGNGQVDFSDLITLLAAWGPCGS